MSYFISTFEFWGSGSSAVDDEWTTSDKITSEDSSDDKSFISISGIDGWEETFKNIDFNHSK